MVVAGLGCGQGILVVSGQWSVVSGQWSVVNYQHRSLNSDLMSTILAEHNYIRLLDLIPNLDLLDGECVSDPDGQRLLWLRIVEQTPYSTLCDLHEYSSGSDDVAELEAGVEAEVEEIALTLRVYHDARVADLLSYRNRFGGSEVFDARVLQTPGLNKKRELNFFLWKWLGHCLARGHKLSSGSLQPVNS